jgi:hypothetical protein
MTFSIPREREETIENVSNVNLENVERVAIILNGDDIEVTFTRPVTCVAEEDKINEVFYSGLGLPGKMMTLNCSTSLR